MKTLTCQQSDRDVPELICGYPLPCPYHTVVIDTEANPPTVTIPATFPKAANSNTLDKLKRIARIIK